MMNACINVSHINAMYEHVHHGAWCDLKTTKLEKIKNSWHAILSLCVVRKTESMTPLSGKKLYDDMALHCTLY